MSGMAELSHGVIEASEQTDGLCSTPGKTKNNANHQNGKKKILAGGYTQGCLTKCVFDLVIQSLVMKFIR